MFSPAILKSLKPYFHKSFLYNFFSSLEKDGNPRLCQVIFFHKEEIIAAFSLSNWNHLEAFLYCLWFDPLLDPQNNTELTVVVKKFSECQLLKNDFFQYSVFAIHNHKANLLSLQEAKERINVDKGKKYKLVPLKDILPSFDPNLSLNLPDEVNYKTLDKSDCYQEIKKATGKWANLICSSFGFKQDRDTFLQEVILELGKHYAKWVHYVQNSHPFDLFDTSTDPTEAGVTRVFSNLLDWSQEVEDFYSLNEEPIFYDDATDPISLVCLIIEENWRNTKEIHDDDIPEPVEELIIEWAHDLFYRLSKCPSIYFYTLCKDLAQEEIRNEELEFEQEEEGLKRRFQTATDVVHTFFPEFKDEHITKSSSDFWKAFEERLPLLNKKDIEALLSMGLPISLSKAAAKKIESMLFKFIQD